MKCEVRIFFMLNASKWMVFPLLVEKQQVKMYLAWNQVDGHLFCLLQKFYIILPLLLLKSEFPTYLGYEGRRCPAYFCLQDISRYNITSLVAKLWKITIYLILPNKLHAVWDVPEPNRPIVQILRCTSTISHNEPFCNRPVHMRTHFC